MTAVLGRLLGARSRKRSLERQRAEQRHERLRVQLAPLVAPLRAARKEIRAYQQMLGRGIGANELGSQLGKVWNDFKTAWDVVSPGVDDDTVRDALDARKHEIVLLTWPMILSMDDPEQQRRRALEFLGHLDVAYARFDAAIGRYVSTE